MALALLFGGLCFRITAVPFHFYAPDVYQGTSYPNAALLSVIPKAAGFVVLARLLVAAMPGMEVYAWRTAAVIAVLTMTTGNVLALWQDDLRRLLAYSSIAHAGYMLIGLAVALATGNEPGSWNGLAALGFYLVVYAAATLGAFAVLEHLGRPERRIDGVDELAGLGQTRPVAAALLAVFLLSLMGVPPLGGFWGKFCIFGSALNVNGAGVEGIAEGMQPWFTGAGRYRRAERGRGRGLLSPRGRRDVLPHALGHATSPGRRRSMVGRRNVRRGRRARWMFSRPADARNQRHQRRPFGGRRSGSRLSGAKRPPPQSAPKSWSGGTPSNGVSPWPVTAKTAPRGVAVEEFPGAAIIEGGGDN